jgi:hypothetical protein
VGKKMEGGCVGESRNDFKNIFQQRVRPKQQHQQDYRKGTSVLGNGAKTAASPIKR